MKIGEINIKKLHIDDWVRIKSSNKVGQVSKICTYKNQDHDTVSVDGLVCASNNIEPVELTPDIIASSGVVVVSENEYLIKREHYNVSFYYVKHSNIIGSYDVIVGENDEVVFWRIKYVHELQHLLDIFNIDCKINLG